MKKLIALLSLLVCTSVYSQQYYVESNLAATNKTLIATPLVLEQLTAYSTNANVTTLYLLDGYYTTTNAAWTNYTSAVTNVVTTYITSTGITNSLTNAVYKTFPNPHAASTAVTPTLRAYQIPGAPTGGTSIIQINDSLVFGQRMTVSNSSAGLNILVQYRTQ